MPRKRRRLTYRKGVDANGRRTKRVYSTSTNKLSSEAENEYNLEFDISELDDYKSRLGKYHSCDLCRKYFYRSVFFMRNHVRHHINKPSPLPVFKCDQNSLEYFVCSSCKFKTKLLLAFNHHLQTPLNSKKKTRFREKSYKCKQCAFFTNSVMFLFKHNDTHKKP